MAAQGRSEVRQSVVRSGKAARSDKAALGAAFVARGLVGSTAGARKSPGLLGSIMLTLIGGLFFGVGVYVNTHAAELAAKPGNSGSPRVLGWGFVGIGGLVLLVGALTLLSRLAALIIGVYLLIAGRFETAAAPTATAPGPFAPGPNPPGPFPAAHIPPGPIAPAPIPAAPHGTAPPAPAPDSAVAGVGAAAYAPLLPPPLVPPPLDPRLPGPNS